jgi:hypothetical protein
MIVFVPAYDPATHLNLVIARRILPDGCRALLGPEATRAALFEALEGSGDAPLLAMSHGEKERLLAQNRRTTDELRRAGIVDVKEQREVLRETDQTALEPGDGASVRRRSIFVYACNTGTHLGSSLVGAGAVYWGYTGKINTPAENPSLDFLFVPIFEYIRDAWPDARSERTRRDVLNRIETLCESAAQTLDDLAEKDAELDVLSAGLCLLHIWDRLRIWTAGADSPEHHPRAHLPLLLM